MGIPGSPAVQRSEGSNSVGALELVKVIYACGVRAKTSIGSSSACILSTATKSPDQNLPRG